MATVLIMGLTLALASCGGGGSADGGSGDVTAGGETVRASGAHAAGGAGAKETGGAKTGGDEEATASRASTSPGRSTTGTAGCQHRLGDFLDRMNDLRQSLLAGLSYSEYVVRVRAIRDAYEAVPVDRLGAGCVTGPAAAAEDAFNQYLRAANTWGDCAATAGCAASEVEGRLQRHWHTASKSLVAAERQG
jgi:hypothetical protein